MLVNILSSESSLVFQAIKYNKLPNKPTLEGENHRQKNKEKERKKKERKERKEMAEIRDGIMFFQLKYLVGSTLHQVQFLKDFHGFFSF